jgi:putative transposase
MKGRRHTPEQIIRKLAEGEKLSGQGQSIEEVARYLEVTESTWHRWRAQYGGMKADDTEGAREGERSVSGVIGNRPRRRRRQRPTTSDCLTDVEAS